MYIWVGKGASEDEEHGAKYMCELLKCKATRITEGQEPGKRTQIMQWTATSFYPAFFKETFNIYLCKGTFG